MRKLFLGLLMSSVVDAATVGSVAPTFSGKNQNGKTINLSDFSGHPVLLYFYPKDDTPGCTKEACEFRDKYAEFKKRGAVVLGVSRQDVKSHQAFSGKFHLLFDLIVDSDGAIGKAYGIPTIPILGYFKRRSVLIGKDGHILKFYDSVDPKTHAQQALNDLEHLDK